MDASSSKGTHEIEIRLGRALDDPREDDPVFQQEIKPFGSALRAADIRFSQSAIAFDSAVASGYPLAEYLIKDLAPAVFGVIGTAIGAWITGRQGRRVRIKVGGIEVEARTMDEVELLLQRARALQASASGRPIDHCTR